MSSRRSAFRSGMRDVAPLLVGVAPFGLVVGVGMVAIGIPATHAVAMSTIVFAGASQLAAAELLATDAPLLVVVLVALVVNLRFTMYSASIAPHFRRLTGRSKTVAAAFLVDMNYALSITKFAENEEIDRLWYYLGTSIPIWVTWVVATVVGVALGARVPAGWHLEFAVPLIFIALAIRAVEGRATAATALAAGVLAVSGQLLPLELGLLVAAFGGVLVGLAVEGRVT